MCFLTSGILNLSALKKASCDSLDIMFRGKMTVRQEEGDLILVPICGAYTSASATTFNGFSKANFVVWEDVKETLMVPQLLKAQ